jgi:Na+/proline symporter
MSEIKASKDRYKAFLPLNDSAMVQVRRYCIYVCLAAAAGGARCCNNAGLAESQLAWVGCTQQPGLQ